jgi:cellulose synthase/poly-beta-1,6-N-acetylglucosamine synthase-like glycosyltransferase
MKLDVLVATCERPELLSRTLESLLSAPVPVGLDVHVTVIHNDDSQGTRDVVERAEPAFHGRLHYVHERRRGKSHALNRGIRATSGDLIGLIDDDEEIEAGWYAHVVHAFRDERVDFIGGPCLPRWGAVPPAWMPAAYRGVIGYVDDGDRVMVFGKDAPGILMGGNAVIRRRVLQRTGTFLPELGPTPDRRMFSGEDEDLYARLLIAGAHGLYIPGLKIYHYVPPERLTKRYYRSWCFWNGVSRSVIDSHRPSHVIRVGKVPRYLYGAAVRGLMRVLRPFRHRVDPASRFSAELALWHLLGFVYGSYFHRSGGEAR